MGKYILKRIGYMLLVFVILSMLLYLIYNLIPFNRASAIAEENKARFKNDPEGLEQFKLEKEIELGLKKYDENGEPQDVGIFMRYLGWMGLAPVNGQFQGLLQGNFGYSYEYNRPVMDALAEPMQNTMFLNIFSVILALAVTIPLGIFCAVHRGSKRDSAIQVFTIVGYSIPFFIIAILFIWLFASTLGWFPVSGMKTPGSDYTGMKKFLDQLYYMALPLIVMTFGSLGGMTRYVRASMTEALTMDCVRTARAKGVKEKVVVYSHAWRNALIPVITLVIGWFISIFAGSIMLENIFGLNGMGKILIQSLSANDLDMVLCLELFYASIGLLGNLIVDIAYGIADPRIRVNK